MRVKDKKAGKAFLRKRLELATDFAKSLVDKYGVAADVAVHEPSERATSRTTTRIFSS